MRSHDAMIFSSLIEFGDHTRGVQGWLPIWVTRARRNTYKNSQIPDLKGRLSCSPVERQ